MFVDSCICKHTYVQKMHTIKNIFLTFDIKNYYLLNKKLNIQMLDNYTIMNNYTNNINAKDK